MTPHVTGDSPSFQSIAKATLVVTVLVLLLVIGVGWRASQAADNAGQVARGNELTACRSQVRVETVDTAVLDELLLVLDGLTATFRGDAAMRAEVDRKVEPLRDQIAASRRRLAAETTQSIEDPARFLAECREKR